MPLPGETSNSFGGRRGSYNPGEELNDTPYKPVPLAFQQEDGTLQVDATDQNRNAMGSRFQTRREAASREQRRKAISVAAIIIIAIIVLLAIILPLAICLGSDRCTWSSPTSEEPSKLEWAYQAQLRGTLTAPVISDPGNAPFGEFLNASLEANTTTTSIAPTLATITIGSTPSVTTTVPRLRRDVGSETATTMAIDNGNGTAINRFSPIDLHVMDKIRNPLLESIKSSALCQGIDCTDLSFEEMRLDNDVLSCRFGIVIGSDDPLPIEPTFVQNFTATTVQNFSDAFNLVFPGYRLGQVDLAFDLVEFCNFTAVYCSNFTNINDTLPTTTTILLTTTTAPTTTIPDRSVILLDNETFLFNFTTTDRSTQASSTIASSSMSTSTAAPRPSVPVVVGMADCSKYGFMCTNQETRVATRERCDGVIQCPDGSDEQLCETCRTSFSCPNGDGSWMCLRGQVVCNGKQNCPTDYDEAAVHCKATCLPSEYRCRNSKACIPKRWLCDGDVQCPEGDDESDCTMASKCNNNAYFCEADRKCIGAWTVCNGVYDCTDGADEARCSCLDCSGNRTALCSSPYGKCILKTQVCDGKEDCPNAEDESKCPP